MRRSRALGLLSLLVAVTLSACGASTGRHASRERNLITAEEIAEVQVFTAWDAIQQLRPAFLRGRYSMSADAVSLPIVYVDGLRYGGAEELRRIRAVDVATIRFLSPSDATTRFGTGHTGGALLVEMRGTGGI